MARGGKAETAQSVSPGEHARAREPAAEWVPIDAVKPWGDNPRKNDIAAKKVAESIKRFGFGAPLVARKENGELIAGHTRLKAARLLGLDRVPVRFVDLDPAEAHLLALADNKLGEVAEWEPAKLADILSEYGLEQAELAGWDAVELEKLADEVPGFGPLDSEGDVVDDEVPEPPKDPITKPGDVWQLGEHRLVCGDCREPGTLVRLMDGARAAVVFTSPPYASQRKYDPSSGFKPIPPDAYANWWEAVQAGVRSVLAEDGSFFVNIKEHCEDGQRHLYVKKLTIAMVERWGWRFVDELCWRNTCNGVPGTWPDRFKNAWEPILHFATGKIRFRPMAVAHVSDKAFDYDAASHYTKSNTGLLGGGHKERSGLALPSNVIEASAEGQQGAHAAPFPIALPTFFARAFSDPGDAVLDPFMGSGTTIVACERESRRGYGAEISPAYCDVIVERWQNLTGASAQRVGSVQ